MADSITVKRFCFISIIGLLLVCSSATMAGGISADAGLTPAQDKWMVRTQIRFLERTDDPSAMKREMDMYMFPLVVAYGIRPEVTVMIRQAYMNRDMTMNSVTTTSSGFGDLMVMVKYRALRHNTRNYTFGLAPTLAVEFPTGRKAFTSDGTNMKMGLYVSGRRGPWASDLNANFTINGSLGGGSDRVRNQIVEITAAAARQFSLDSRARSALAPVVEISYGNRTPDRKSGIDLPNSGESWLNLSPGVKYTRSRIILEGLVQVPIWQNQIGVQTERGICVLFGIRLFL